MLLLGLCCMLKSKLIDGIISKLIDRTRSGMFQEMSPGVTSSVKEKERTYELMIKLSRDQLNNKPGRVIPTLMTCVISHESEFSRPFMLRTIETPTQHYRNMIKVKPHLFETGEKLGKKTCTHNVLKIEYLCRNI